MKWRAECGSCDAVFEVDGHWSEEQEINHCPYCGHLLEECEMEQIEDE